MLAKYLSKTDFQQKMYVTSSLEITNLDALRIQRLKQLQLTAID